MHSVLPSGRLTIFVIIALNRLTILFFSLTLYAVFRFKYLLKILMEDIESYKLHSTV
jgi:hypothetical protein